MPRYQPEPAHSHGTPGGIGVLLVNLGTPDAPTPAALRRYLAEFLSDPRVVEIPRALWWPILHGIILRTRPAASARKYAKVWTDEGSPLAVHTRKQAGLLQGYLARAGHAGVKVLPAMRYGEPSVASQMDALRQAGCTRVLVLPLYPQYSASTTGSVADALGQWAARTRNLPALRLARGFHDHAGYVAALAESVRRHWAREGGRAERLVISFHGVPRRALDLGDPYHCECHKTGRLLREALGLAEQDVQVSFQSRFGRAEWLQPYTQPTLETLARGGTRTVDIICPGFVSDCLETLEEIAMECRAAFMAAGGQALRYVPCLNEDDAFIRVLQRMVETQASDWLAAPAPSPGAMDATRQRALALGART